MYFTTLGKPDLTAEATVAKKNSILPGRTLEQDQEGRSMGLWLAGEGRDEEKHLLLAC